MSSSRPQRKRSRSNKHEGDHQDQSWDHGDGADAIEHAEFIPGRYRGNGDLDEDPSLSPLKKNSKMATGKTKKTAASTKTKSRKKPSSSKTIDLSDIPYQPPILKNDFSLFHDNSRKRPRKEHSSQYMGIYFDPKLQSWKAQIHIEGRVTSIGYYKDETQAAEDYARAAHKYKRSKDEVRTTLGGLDCLIFQINL